MMLSLLLFAIVTAPCVVIAQNQTFINGFLAKLSNMNLTVLAATMERVNIEPSEVQFFLTISDMTTTKTFFAPTNDAIVNDIASDDSMTFLGGLLLYHLAKGTWTSDNLGTGANHSIISTQLTGHKVSFLEGDRPQVIACGIPNQSSEINIYNQALQTVVLNTNTYQGITIHTINHVISFPGFYSSALGMLGLTKFPNVQQDAGVSNSTLDNTTGFTVFAFTDMAYGNNAAKVTGVSSQALFNNHIIMGQTVWYSTFSSSKYTSVSGHQYTFTLASSQDYVVTIGASSARIIHSDVLVNNGVIHVIDSVLWDTNPKTTSAPARPTSTSNPTSAPHTSNSSVSSGLIAGVTIGVAAFLVIVAFGVFLMLRRRHDRGRETILEPSEGFSSPVTPVVESIGGPLTPFMSSYEDTQPSPPSRSSKNPRGRLRPQSDVGAFIPHPPYSSPSVTSDQPPSVASDQLRANTEYTNIPDEVVDRLLERFTARIDGGERSLEHLNAGLPTYRR